MTSPRSRPSRLLACSVANALSSAFAALCLIALGQHALSLVAAQDMGDEVLGGAGLFVLALFAPFALGDLIVSIWKAIRELLSWARRIRARASRPTVRHVVQPPFDGPYRSSSAPVSVIVAPRSPRLRIVFWMLVVLAFAGVAIAASLRGGR